jgi:hypothetical protein
MVREIFKPLSHPFVLLVIGACAHKPSASFDHPPLAGSPTPARYPNDLVSTISRERTKFIVAVHSASTLLPPGGRIPGYTRRMSRLRSASNAATSATAASDGFASLR